MFLIADNYCIYVLGHSIHLALHPFPLPCSKCESEGPFLHSAPHHFAIPPSLVMRVGGEIPPFLPWRLSHHPHHHTLTLTLYHYHPNTSLAASMGQISHSSSSRGAWDVKHLKQIVCFLFLFLFFILNTLLVTTYRCTTLARTVNHHYTQRWWKELETDASWAQVCFFFLFFTYSINDFILIGYISTKIMKTDTTTDGHRRHVMATDPTWAAMSHPQQERGWMQKHPKRQHLLVCRGWRTGQKKAHKTM